MTPHPVAGIGADQGAPPAVRLHVFKSAWGGMQPSNFCIKIEVWLQLAGIAYTRVESNLASRAPRGRVPYISFADGTWIDDSEHIIETLGSLYGVDPDAPLGEGDRAISRAVQRMVDEHMFFMLIDSRWMNPATWPRVRDNFFGPWPVPLRYLVGWMYWRGVRHRLRLQGLGRYSPAERLHKARANVQALDRLLADKPFMLGTAPYSVDAAVYGMLAAIIHPDFDTALSALVRHYPRLMAYAARMEARFGRGIG